MSQSPEQEDVDERKAVLEFRRLLVSFFVSFSLLFVAVYATLQVFKPEVTAASAWFVHTLGGAGIGLGYFLPDAFTLPIPNDAFALVGRVGGMTFMAVVAWGTAGSIVGGSVGWVIGKYLVGRVARLQWYFDRVGSRMMERFQRGGAWILFVAALTPLPYSVACWAAGAIGMPYTRFVLISLIRVVRVAGYLWVLERGLGPLGP